MRDLVLAVTAGLLSAVLVLAGLLVLDRTDSLDGLPGIGIGAGDGTDEHGTTAAADPARTTPRVAFLGDSFTHGGGASSEPHRWSSRVAAAQGWTELNFAVGGSSFAFPGTSGGPGAASFTGHVPQVAGAAPDLVIVATAGNHASRTDQHHVDGTFRALREALPHTPVVALAPFHRRGADQAVMDRLDGQVRRAVADTGGCVLDYGSPLATVGEDHFDDAIHPNDTGYAVLAGAVLDAYRAAHDPEARGAVPTDGTCTGPVVTGTPEDTSPTATGSPAA